MSTRKTFILALTSALLTVLLCMVFIKLYNQAYLVDYSQLLNFNSILLASIISGIILSWGNFLFLKIFKKHGQIIFNVTSGAISFISILLPLKTTLPLTIESPEFFPGLAMTLHFFPLLCYLVILPLFKNKLIE